MLRRTKAFGLILVASLLLAACEQLGWQRIPAAEETNPLPRIEWVTPSLGAILDGSVTLRVQAVGDAEFIAVTFTVNGIEVGTSTTGSLTFDSDLLQLAPGVVQASATAVNEDGATFSAARFFVVVDADKPMVEWVAPLVLRDFAPFEAFDLTVDVADASGSLSSLVFMIDGNVVERQMNITGVDAIKRVTFRWTPGFWVSLNKVVPLRVIATNGQGGVYEIHRDIVSVPPRLVVPDTQAPDVWWQQSTVWNNMAVAGSVSLRALAEDNVQVAYFDFYINGALRERKLASSIDQTLPRRYADFVWNTLDLTPSTDGQLSPSDQRLYPDDTYEVKVEAVDTSNNRSVAAVVNVRVANDDKVAPEAEWYYDDGMLHNNAILSGTAELTLLGRDFGGSGVVAFDVYLDGQVLSRVEPVFPYVRVRSSTDYGVKPAVFDDGEAPVPFGFEVAGFWDWDTTKVLSGHYDIGVVAIDAAGNRSPMKTVRVLVHPTFRVFVDPEADSYLAYSEPYRVTSSVNDVSNTEGRRKPGQGIRLERNLTVLPDNLNDYTTICWVRLTAAPSEVEDLTRSGTDSAWSKRDGTGTSTERQEYAAELADELRTISLRPVVRINGEGPSPSTGAFTTGSTINSWIFTWNPGNDYYNPESETDTEAEAEHDEPGYYPIEVWGNQDLWDDEPLDPSEIQTVLDGTSDGFGQRADLNNPTTEGYVDYFHAAFYFGAQVGVSYSGSGCASSLDVTVLNAVPVRIEEDVWYSSEKRTCGGSFPCPVVPVAP